MFLQAFLLFVVSARQTLQRIRGATIGNSSSDFTPWCKPDKDLLKNEQRSVATSCLPKCCFFPFGDGVRFVSQRCALEAAESNGHPSATMTVVLSACIGPLVTVSVCTVSKICQLFLKKKKKEKTEGGLMVDVFLRICSTAQHQMEDTFNLFSLRYNHKWAGAFIRKSWEEERFFFFPY